MSSVWALWKYLKKAGPCQPAMKQHLSIYFIYSFNVHSILQCLKTRIKNSYWFAKHFYLNCSLRTLEMAFLEEHAALPRPKRLAPCPWTLILVSLINKKIWTVCLIPKIPFLGIYLYSILYQGWISGVRYQTFTIFSYIGILWGQKRVYLYPTAPWPSPRVCWPNLKIW